MTQKILVDIHSRLSGIFNQLDPVWVTGASWKTVFRTVQTLRSKQHRLHEDVKLHSECVADEGKPLAP